MAISTKDKKHIHRTPDNSGKKQKNVMKSVHDNLVQQVAALANGMAWMDSSDSTVFDVWTVWGCNTEDTVSDPGVPVSEMSLTPQARWALVQVQKDHDHMAFEIIYGNNSRERLALLAAALLCAANNLWIEMRESTEDQYCQAAWHYANLTRLIVMCVNEVHFSS